LKNCKIVVVGKADLSGRARKPAMFDINEAKASGIRLSGKIEELKN